MITGHCFTNLDEYRREEWPTCFVAVPRVGERIEAKESERSLRVVCVTHCERTSGASRGMPTLKIELHR